MPGTAPHIHCYNLQFPVPMDGDALTRAMTFLPEGDGLSPHNVRLVGDGNREVVACIHIERPITAEKIELGRLRLMDTFFKATAEAPRDSGIHERNIRGTLPEALQGLGENFLSQLKGFRALGSVAGLVLVLGGIVVLLTAIRR